MEGFLWILLIIALLVGPIRIFRWLAGLGASAISPDSGLAGKLNPTSLQVSVTQEEIEFSGGLLDCYQLKMRGKISAPYAGFPYKVIVHLLDVTDGEEKPVLCAIDQLQEAKTIAFEFSTEPLKLPYEESVMAEWVPVVTVPRDVLTMARSGTRRLRFRLDIVNATKPPFFAAGVLIHSPEGSILNTASRTTDVVMSEVGYEDVKDNRRMLDGVVLKLAMAVSASDGSMDQSEGDVIRQWLTKQIAHIANDDNQAKEKGRLNGQVADAYKAAENGQLNIPKLCETVKKVGTTGDCYDIVELCLHVAAADGEAQGAELQMVRRIAKLLGVSLDRLRAMEEKIVPISMHIIEQDAESLLGITSEMSSEEIRKQLNREYRKWNSRSAHKDASVRQQASQMLKIIAKCRRKYVA